MAQICRPFEYRNSPYNFLIHSLILSHCGLYWKIMFNPEFIGLAESLSSWCTVLYSSRWHVVQICGRGHRKSCLYWIVMLMLAAVSGLSDDAWRVMNARQISIRYHGKKLQFPCICRKKKNFFLSLGTRQCGPSPPCCHRREATVRSFSSLLPWLQKCFLACRPSLVKCWLTTKRTFRIICRCRPRFKATTALLARKVKARHAIIRRRVEPNTREQVSAKDAGIALWILEVAYRKSYSNATNWMPEVWNRRIIG